MYLYARKVFGPFTRFLCVLTLTSPCVCAYFEKSSNAYSGDLGPFECLQWHLRTSQSLCVDKPIQEEVELVLFIRHLEKEKVYKQFDIEVFFENSHTHTLLGKHTYRCHLGLGLASGKKKKLVLRMKHWENVLLHKHLSTLNTQDLKLHFILKDLKEKKSKSKQGHTP